MDSRHLVAESVVQPLSAKQVDMINDLFQSIRSNQLPAVGNALRNLATQHQHINIANIVDKKNQTVLHEAACLEDPNIARLLISCIKNININAVDDEGLTPLHYAARQNAVYTATSLIRGGYSVEISSNQDIALEKNTIYFESHKQPNLLVYRVLDAKSKLQHGTIIAAQLPTRLQNKIVYPLTIELLHELLPSILVNTAQRAHTRSGADINAVSQSDLTALHVAAQHNSLKVFACLLASSANPSKQNDAFETAFDIAIKQKHWRIAHLLTQHDAKLFPPYLWEGIRESDAGMNVSDDRISRIEQVITRIQSTLAMLLHQTMTSAEQVLELTAASQQTLQVITEQTILLNQIFGLFDQMQRKLSFTSRSMFFQPPSIVPLSNISPDHEDGSDEEHESSESGGDDIVAIISEDTSSTSTRGAPSMSYHA